MHILIISLFFCDLGDESNIGGNYARWGARRLNGEGNERCGITERTEGVKCGAVEWAKRNIF